MDFGLWTLDFGLWTLDFGLWTLDFFGGLSLGKRRHGMKKAVLSWAPLLRKRDVGICCLDELVEQVFQVLLATGADGGLTVAEGIGAEVIEGDLLGFDFGADAGVP